MKNLILSGIVVGLVTFLVLTNNHYTTTMEVVRQEVNGTTCIVDNNGEEWTFNSDGGYRKGDKVIVTMDNNGTETYIYDDKVIGIRKAR